MTPSADLSDPPRWPSRPRAVPSGLAGAQGRPDAWRTAFTVFAIVMSVNAFYATFSGAPVGSVIDGKAHMPSNRGSLLYVGAWLALYAASAWILLRAIARNGVDLRLVAIAPLAGYIVLSAGWAPNFAASVVPATMVALNMVTAAALAAAVHPARFLTIFAWTNTALVAMSLVALAVDPDGVRTDLTRSGILMSGELFGVYGNKTVLGMSSAISILILLFRPGRLSMAGWPAVGLLAVGLVLSNSAASLGSVAIAGAALSVARLAPGLGRPVFTVTSLGAILFSLALPFIDVGAIAGALGRSSDFTGRSTFWPFAIEAIQERPFFGYGYLGFFDDGPYSKAWEVWSHELYFFTPNFHSSVLDVTVGLGLVGCAGYIALLVASAAIFAHPTLERRWAYLLGAILIVYILNSATNFFLLVHNQFGPIFQYYCFFVLGRRYPIRLPIRSDRPRGPDPRAGSA